MKPKRTPMDALDFAWAAFAAAVASILLGTLAAAAASAMGASTGTVVTVFAGNWCLGMAVSAAWLVALASPAHRRGRS